MLVSEGGVPLNIIHLLRIFRTNSLDWLTGNRGDDGFDHQIGGLPVIFPAKSNPKIYIWLVVWNMNFMTFHILGMSSSQLTNSYFSEG